MLWLHLPVVGLKAGCKWAYGRAKGICSNGEGSSLQHRYSAATHPAHGGSWGLTIWFITSFLDELSLFVPNILSTLNFNLLLSLTDVIILTAQKSKGVTVTGVSEKLTTYTRFIDSGAAYRRVIWNVAFWLVCLYWAEWAPLWSNEHWLIL